MPYKMGHINVRFPDPDLLRQLNFAAITERRPLRQFIRHALREELAKKGYLDYHEVNPRLLLSMEHRGDA